MHSGHLPSYTRWMGWNPPLSPQPWRKHMEMNMALCLHQQGSCLLCGKGQDLQLGIFYSIPFPLLPFIFCPKVPFSMVYSDNLPVF